MGMEKLKTKIASIRDAWPDILTAIKAGHSLKHVCERLNEDGVAVQYKMLRAYVSVVRRERAQRSAPRLAPKPRSTPVLDPVQVPPTSVPTISRKPAGHRHGIPEQGSRIPELHRRAARPGQNFLTLAVRKPPLPCLCR